MGRIAATQNFIFISALPLFMFACSDDFSSVASKKSESPAVRGEEFSPGKPDIPATVVLSKSNKCAVDSVNSKSIANDGTWLVEKSQEAFLSGWALEINSRSAEEKLYVNLLNDDQIYHAATTTRDKRNDVSSILGLSENARIGFELRALFQKAKPGTYAITLVQFSQTSGTECSAPGKLVIK